MILTIIIGIYIATIIFEYIPIIKTKKKNEIILYSSLLIMSSILLVLIAVDITLPSPTNLIKSLLKPIIKV